MPISCFPCSSASTAAHFDDKQLQGAEAKNTSVKVEDGLQRPTGTEYAGEAAKEFLRILEAVAQEIPIPGVGAAVKIATNLIKACEESQATLEKAEELKLRIKTLVTVVVNASKEKKPDEVGEKLKKDIDALQGELKYIQKKLDDITSQHAFLLVFFRSFNEQKVQNCMNRLDGLLERFTMERQIDHANLLHRLEKDITSFYNEQKKTLDHIRKVVEDTNVTMEHVAAILKSAPTAGSSSSPGTNSLIPPSTSLFYGRDALVSDLASRLTTRSASQKRHHVCILGPGGMGKTSTALAVMAHPNVKKHLPDSNRVWIPCVKATSVALLLDTLCSSLGITQMTGNVHENFLSVLNSSGPLILLLDNFETPWNADGERSETERLLREVDQIPHITLFVTMRSSTPPCTGLLWHSIDLKAVDADAAQQIYSEIYPNGSTDPGLPALLETIGHMPLAITLMAKIASITNVSAKILTEQYNAVGPSLLSQGSDAENSMDICIGLSVDSPPMKRSPEAQWLLGALSVLQVGTTFDILSKWWAPHLSNPLGALQVLRDTSLVERRDSTFYVLPVIQRYVLDSTHLTTEIRALMIESASKYLAQHSSSPSEKLYKEHAQALAAEESNLEALLLQAAAPSAEIIDAHLILARYQASTRPRTNVVGHALELVLRMANSKGLHAAVLSSCGHVYSALNRYEEAEKHFDDARALFLTVPDVNKAADCLLRIVDNSLFASSKTHSERLHLLSRAQSEFESIGDAHGVAQCWFLRGWSARSAWDFDTAIELLLRAHHKSTEYGDLLLSARCSDMLASSYYWKGDMMQAETWYQSAIDGFGRVGPSEWALDAAFGPGLIFNASGNYAAALKVFVRCLEESKNSGTPLNMAFALRNMGVSWMKMGKKEDARSALQEALEVFPSIPGRIDPIVCRYLLRKVDDPNAVPTHLEKDALNRVYPKEVQRVLGF